MQANPDIDFREDITDEELRKAYSEMAVLVCNSVDNFESGPLPPLEAMASGVPVLTRNVGVVPDIYDENNMIVRAGKKDDIEILKGELNALMNNKELRLEIRKEGWNTVRGYSSVKMAKQYAKLYNNTFFEEPLVSVIIPTFNREKQIVEILKSLDDQIYENVEAVVVDDNSSDGTESAVKGLREQVRYPIKYVSTARDGYNLAMARNLGAIESEGEVLVFCDSRLRPYSEAVYQFVKYVLKNRDKVWYYGDKGAGNRGFVENFSAVRRSHFIDAGMFCERLTRYGGITQEIRTRFGKQGFVFRYLQFAKAKEILSSKAKNKRDDIWRSKLLLWKMYEC